ncbi:kinase-like domain-containing protein [Aspergillus avenaceus]|uniref:Kinase-like domain-containing protein n=1 Tax=Aspergillus avenaceus TaxID=36643 RepID=A0A5N6TTN0_ASPAV|nr:kinase-like domain-containing protein [Aspergillus avenaceus]
MSPNSAPEIFTYADFDLQALCRRARTLRQGVSCVCNPDQQPNSGSFNWAIFITFEDGIRWVFRSPHHRTFMPIELGMKLLASEAATLRYLKAHSDVPVPEVYDYCASSENDIGIPFIIMSEASGRPLSKFWKSAGSSQPGLDIPSKAKVLTQLGAITWKLSQLRFDKIGSIFEEDGIFKIQECLSRGHVLHGRYDLDISRGPFTSETKFYKSLISTFSEHAEILQLSHHCFVAPVPILEDYQSITQYRTAVDLWSDFVTIGCKTDSSENRLDYIIAGDTLHDIIPRLQLPAIDRKTFPLCHADLSVNNIYVDDNYNITCIIDWAFASSIPESLLLAAPGLPQYRDEISLELLAPFINGFITAMPGSIEEKLIAKYRETLEHSQVSWRLSRLLNLDSINDYDLFATAWHSARPGEDMGKYFLQRRRSPHYTQVYLDVKQEDQPPSKIQKDEKDYFQNKDLRKTIAKKLTLMSEWKTQYAVDNAAKPLRRDMFVTSPALWKWIEQFMQEWTDMVDTPTKELRP